MDVFAVVVVMVALIFGIVVFRRSDPDAHYDERREAIPGENSRSPGDSRFGR